VSLITSTNVFQSSALVHTSCNIRALLLDANHHVASFVIETHSSVIESDMFDGITNNVLVIHMCRSSDFTKNKTKTGLGASFASNFGVGILPETGIQHSIRHLITKFIRMAF